MMKLESNSQSHKSTVLVLGGAGFVGSNIAKAFVNAGYKTIVIDGLLSNTGGKKSNLDDITAGVRFIESIIEDVSDLPDIIQESDIIVDSMAWAFHRLALADPFYDLKLNLESHIYLISV